MIETNKDFVSEVKNHLKANNKDDRTSSRYILSVAYSYVEYLINTRPLSKVFRDLSTFTYVPCVEMEKVSSVKCDVAEFRTCKKIMRSKKEIPAIFNAKSGYIIESITNIDNSEEYHYLRSPKDYTQTSKRKFGKIKKYFYIADNYLYILNTQSEIVNINALFFNEKEAKCLSDCEECNECQFPLDNKFVCPKELISTVRDQTVNIILTGRRSISADENPDLDENQKTRTK